jgi:hypothetical protein
MWVRVETPQKKQKKQSCCAGNVVGQEKGK